MSAKSSIKLIGRPGDEWPIIETLWDFFNSKGIRTVFFSVGTSPTAMADAEITETLGCPLHIWDPREEGVRAWEEVVQTLKDRKRPDSATTFSEGIDTKWILPKNIHIHKALPSSFSGSADIAGNMYETISIERAVEEACASMKVEARIDILKVAIGAGLERDFLFTLMNSPYRPGILLIEWSEKPDEHFLTTCCAGHVQQCGYSLVSKKNSHFFYLFNGDCAYETCSWEDTKVNNPLTAEIYNSLNRSLS